jgi:hypothetical protein
MPGCGSRGPDCAIGSNRMRSFRSVVVAIALLVLATLPQSVAADPPNLLKNGNFATGTGIAPDHWRTEAWINSPTAVQFQWIAPSGSTPGTAVVKNLKANDARWVQTITLRPGWYYVSVMAQSENTGADHAGAGISVLEDGITSPDLHGTSGWRRVGFYLRVGGYGADVDIALRLGGFSSLNTGTAYFRDASVIAVSAPSPHAAAYDLDAIRQASAPTPVGHLWTLIAAFLGLVALATVGWRMYGESIDPPRSTTRPGQRRTKASKSR